MAVVSVGQITLHDTYDGLNLQLSSYSFVVPTNDQGAAGNYSGCSTTAKVMNGNQDVTTEWMIQVASPVGITGSLSGATYTVSAMTLDIAVIDFTASRLGYPDLTARFNVTKSKNAADGLTIVLSNESHTLPADNAGAALSYSNSGTTIRVLEGSTELNAASSNSANGSFTVGTPVVSPSGKITAGGRSYSSKTATISNHSAMAADTDSVTITYPINIRRSNGTTVSLSKTQTITKSKQGSTGDTGGRGTVHVYAATVGTAWNDSEANAALAPAPFNGAKVADRVTMYNQGAGFAETRYWSGTVWILVGEVIDGNLLVTGSITADKINVNDLFARTITLPNDGVLKAGTTEDYAELGGSAYFKAQSGNSTIFKIAKDGSHFIDGRFITNTLPPEAFDANVIPYIRSQLSLGTPSAGGSSSITGTLGAYGVMLTTTETIASSGVGEPASIVVGYGGIEVSVQSMTLPSAAPKITLQVQRITNGGSPVNVGSLKEFIGEFRRTASGSPATYEFSVPSFRVLETDSAPGAGNLQYKAVISLISPINLGDDLGIVTLAASQRAAGTVSGTITWDSLVGTPSNKITLASSGAQLNFPNLGTTDPAGTGNGDVWFRSNQLYFNNNGTVRTVIHSGNPTALASDISQAEAEAGTITTRRWFTAQRVAQAIAAQAPSKSGGGASGTWGIDITGVASGAGYLTTARTFTIGNTGKSFNGSGNVSWTHAEMGTIRNFGSVTVSLASGTTQNLITWLTDLGALNQPSIMKASWSYDSNSDITDTGFGTLELAGCVIETFPDGGTYIIRVTSPSTGTGAGGIHEYVNQGPSYSPGWRRVYTSTLNGNISGSASSISGFNNPTAAATANTIAYRDGSADINARLFRANFGNDSVPSGAVAFRVNNSTDNYIRFCSDMVQVRAWIGANNAGNLTTGILPDGRLVGSYSGLGTLTSERYIANSDSLPALQVNTNYSLHSGGYDASISTSDIVLLATLIPTGNSRNYVIKGVVNHQSSLSAASVGFTLVVRTNTLPSKSCLLTIDQEIIGRDLNILVYNDTASNTIYIAANSPNSSAQNINYKFEMYSRQNYASNLNVYNTKTLLDVTGLTLIPVSTGYTKSISYNLEATSFSSELFKLGSAGGTISPGAAGSARISTLSGYIDVGSTNASYTHFSTDRPAYYFNRTILADGEFKIYNTGTGLNSNGLFFYNGETTLTSDNSGGLVITGLDNESALSFRTAGGVTRGLVYADSGNNIGFLDNTGNWVLRTNKSTDTATFLLNNVYFNSRKAAAYETNNHLFLPSWARQLNGTGIYWDTGMYLYSTGIGQDLNLRSATSAVGFRLATVGDISRGFIYADSTNSIGFLDQTGNWKMRVDSAGMLHVADGTSTSDRRVKRNIQPIQNALAKVKTLTGNTYDQIEMGIRRAGPIAQEVEVVLPEAVSADENGKLAVSQMGLIALLIEAVKDLSTEVDTLKRRLH
jgi:hypothetical protein